MIIVPNELKEAINLILDEIEKHFKVKMSKEEREGNYETLLIFFNDYVRLPKLNDFKTKEEIV